MIAGKHPAIVSKDNFLKINDKSKKHRYGIKLSNDNKNLPLRRFVISAQHKVPMTGYLVRKKGLHYYKTNIVGAKENVSAKLMHQQFKDLLQSFDFGSTKLKEPLKDVMLSVFTENYHESIEQIDTNKGLLIDIEVKLDKLEEKFILDQISKDQYDKFRLKFNSEKEDIHTNIKELGFDLSNLQKALELVVDISPKLHYTWDSGNLETKRSIQKMLFPNGILGRDRTGTPERTGF